MDLAGVYGGKVRIGHEKVLFFYINKEEPAPPVSKRDILARLESGEQGQVVDGVCIEFPVSGVVKFSDGLPYGHGVVFETHELKQALERNHP